jgi:predicted HicB family RNase H-like nuclease
MNQKKVLLTIPEPLHEKLTKKAKELGLSLSAYIRMVLMQKG